MSLPTYEEVCASHRWEVPARYNIAADVCDKHPRGKLAMVWESFDGSTRDLSWGELQDLANQAAHALAAGGVERGDRVAVVLPSTPEAAAVFFAVWKLGAILLSMSVLDGDDAVRHRLTDSGRFDGSGTLSGTLSTCISLTSWNVPSDRRNETKPRDCAAMPSYHASAASAMTLQVAGSIRPSTANGNVVRDDDVVVARPAACLEAELECGGEPVGERYGAT